MILGLLDPALRLDRSEIWQKLADDDMARKIEPYANRPSNRFEAMRRLSDAGVPHLIQDGDIGDPAGLVRGLAARGLDARDALHVCKSAVHDRAYEGPGPKTPKRPASPPPGSP